MKYYGKDPLIIRRCLLLGTLMALVLYIIWLVGTMGNIPRPAFIAIAEKGGNIDVLVQTLSGLLNSSTTGLTADGLFQLRRRQLVPGRDSWPV